MKKFLFLASIAVLTPAMAQSGNPKATAPQIARPSETKPQVVKPPVVKPQIEPMVLALFDQSAFSYSGLASYSGDVRIEIQNLDGAKGLNAVTTGSFFYARNARLKFEGKVEASLGGGEKKYGITTFKCDGSRYQTSQTLADGKIEFSPVVPLVKDGRADAAWQSAPLDSLSPLLIAGINDLRDSKDPLTGVLLPPITRNGESFEGVRLTATAGEYKDMEVVAYFDSKYHLLRDVTISLTIEGVPTRIRTVYSNLTFNPAIAFNMFALN